jgi:excisionase family DNA binding protein
LTVTIEEAAELVGVTTYTIKKWVTQGRLSPLKPNAKPVLFREQDVLDCHYLMISKAKHQRLDKLSAAWRACE